MKTWVRRSPAGLLAITLLLAPEASARTLRGVVTDVPTADVLHVEHEFGINIIQVWGVQIPANPAIAKQAADLVSRLAKGKAVRVRHKSVVRGIIVGRVLIGDDEPVGDVAVELLRAGLATRSSVESGTLDAAEAEARDARRGIWKAR